MVTDLMTATRSSSIDQDTTSNKLCKHETESRVLTGMSIEVLAGWFKRQGVIRSLPSWEFRD